MIQFDYEEKKSLDEAMMQLFSILEVLRGPDGCPWDHALTFKTGANKLLEETYEYIDALASEINTSIKEELGDIFLNAFMLLVMHKESQSFDLAQLFNETSAKLIRRHPHVFGEREAGSKEEVLKIWSEMKKKEKEEELEDAENYFENIPKSLPQLEHSYEMQKKMAKVGFDWSSVEGVYDKIYEEFDELIEAIDLNHDDLDDVEHELGDVLFSVVNLARYIKLNPAVALDKTNRKVAKRFNKVIEVCKEKGIEMTRENSNKLNDIWDNIKARE
ncbi:MAG: nucleoside triphosphate pyrophosphohydrolase [Sphaerochaetaceae bacterium]|jgi:MazG family protein